LDRILDKIREWYRSEAITQAETFFLMTAVIEEVVIVANVNGTFHDFNRNRLWPNSLQELTLRLPLIDPSPEKSATIFCNDVADLAPTLPAHDVTYMDPPYNFRQYTAYYHLINLIAAWPFLEGLDEYLASLTFVRGQNMKDDFSSALCSKKLFTSALRAVMTDINSDWVVLSYYGGRNHWNHWSDTDVPTDEGFRILTTLFEDTDLFDWSESVPALSARLNYQSRVGERKTLIDEHLFIGHRTSGKRPDTAEKRSLSPLNQQFGLEQFGFFKTGATSASEGSDELKPVQPDGSIQVGAK
jgi:hypothetical protein